MTEFAAAIGLSRPTVSNYFKNPEFVRSTTRATIEAGLRRFDYHPNFHAANLGRKSARAIGVIVPSITDPFFSELVNTIEFCSEELGYLTVLQCSHHDAEMEARAIEKLLSMNVAGIAMAPIGFSTNMAMVEKARRNTAMIFMDSQLNNDASFIGNNNAQSISNLVDYFCRTGDPPAFFTLPKLNYSIIERQQAYVNRMNEHGFEPRILNPDPGPVDNNFERFGFEQFLTLSPECIQDLSSVLCVNDRVAFGLIAAATKIGLRIGKGPSNDLRVAGHDNQHFSAYTTPSLTTAAQNIEEIGMLATKALIENDGDNELMRKRTLVNGKMIFRDSA